MTTSRIEAKPSGGIFDYVGRKDRLEEVSRELENPDIWSDQQKAQALGRERSQLENIVAGLDRISAGLSDASEMLALAAEEDDEDVLMSVVSDLESLQADVEQLEFQRMFSGEMDPRPCYLDIQAGSGGTEAQDWAEMLLRMYLRNGAERRGWKV